MLVTYCVHKECIDEFESENPDRMLCPVCKCPLHVKEVSEPVVEEITIHGIETDINTGPDENTDIETIENETEPKLKINEFGFVDES